MILHETESLMGVQAPSQFKGLVLIRTTHRLGNKISPRRDLDLGDYSICCEATGRMSTLTGFLRRHRYLTRLWENLSYAFMRTKTHHMVLGELRYVVLYFCLSVKAYAGLARGSAFSHFTEEKNDQSDHRSLRVEQILGAWRREFLFGLARDSADGSVRYHSLCSLKPLCSRKCISSSMKKTFA